MELYSPSRFTYNNKPIHQIDLLRKLKNQKDQNICTDISIVIKGDIIRAHKTLLCVTVPYIEALTRSSEQLSNDSDTSTINLTHLNSDAVSRIVDFVYTAELEFPSFDGVLDVLHASDFLCMDSVKVACAEFYIENLNEDKFLDIYAINKTYIIANLEQKVTRYVKINAMTLLKKRLLLNIPVDDIKAFFNCDDLAILDEGFPCSAGLQEFLLLSTLLYLHKTSIKEDELKIEDLIKSGVVRLSLMHEDKIIFFLNNLDDENLVREIRNKSDSDFQDRPRNQIEITFYESPRLGISGVSSFNDDSRHITGRHQYVTGMKLFLCLYEDINHGYLTIIGSIKVWYDNGQSVLHGSEYHRNLAETELMPSYEFHLDEDERIVDIGAKSGWMVDSLAFKTSKDRIFGPYGGQGGDPEDVSSDHDGRSYLAFVKGEVSDDYTRQDAIRHLQFVWGCMPVEYN